VHVEDHRQRSCGVRRPHDADAHVADLGGYRDPSILDGQLVDRFGLDVVEHLPGLGRGELVQERGLGRRLDELLRGLLEHDGGLGGGG
jgi:hypothetical protein